MPYHWFDVRMRDGVELVEVELIVGADIDVRAPVFRLIAILRRREDYARSAYRHKTRFENQMTYP